MPHPMKKQFIVTLESEPGYDDWDGIDCGAIKDGVMDWTRLPGTIVAVEEISTRGKPKRLNKELTMMTYRIEDAL